MVYIACSSLSPFFSSYCFGAGTWRRRWLIILLTLGDRLIYYIKPDPRQQYAKEHAFTRWAMYLWFVSQILHTPCVYVSSVPLTSQTSCHLTLQINRLRKQYGTKFRQPHQPVATPCRCGLFSTYLSARAPVNYWTRACPRKIGLMPRSTRWTHGTKCWCLSLGEGKVFLFFL